MDDTRTHRRRRQREEFHRLFELTPEFRRARLALLEQEDRELAAEVARLLELASTEEMDDDGDPAFHAAGEIVGERFRLLRLLGSGGMGEVYLAERCDDVEQQVALKLVRGGAAVSLRRARQERRILARLVHPNIAGFLDAGITANGEPWFAMDYVEGSDIVTSSTQLGLDAKARVRLFAKVCRAVHFAHSCLVLHRDIKPDNVLVDERGEPQLLDFGIGKLLDDSDLRQTRTVALTPAYASPEQMRGEPATTASDIYQLGLLLHELLSGNGPIGSAATFAGRPVRETEKARPSFPRLPADLRTIIAKATRDVVRERYDSAQALADDLERWVQDLPIAAHRSSLTYRALKLARRRPLATATILLLAGGLLASSVIAIDRAERERAQRRLAEEERNRAATTTAFLRDVFRSGDPKNVAAADVRAHDLLTAAAAKLDARTDVDDATRSMLLTELSNTLNGFGMHLEAAEYASRAVELLRPIVTQQRSAYFEAIDALYAADERLDRNKEIVDLVDAAMPAAAALDDAYAPGLLQMRSRALSGLADPAGALEAIRAAISWYERKGAGEDVNRAGALELAARLSGENGDPRSAIALYEEASQLFARAGGDSRERALNRRLQISVSRVQLGQCGDELDALRSLATEMESVLGASHQSTLVSWNQTAQCEAAIGEYRRAIAIQDRVLESTRALASFKSDQRALIEMTRFKLATYAGDPYIDPSDLARRVQELRAANGATRLVARATWVLGELQLQRGQSDRADAALAQALAETRARVGSLPNAELGEIEDSLGRSALQRGDPRSALVHLDSAVAHFEGSRGEAEAVTLRSQVHREWARWVAKGDAATFSEIESLRGRLVKALGSEARPQIWQLDLLIDRLRHEGGLPGIEPDRRNRAEAGLKAPGGQQVPGFVGLNSLS